MKKILALIFTAVACACTCLGFGFATNMQAKAETVATYNTFTMEDGAAARIKSLTDEEGNVVESNGLRFSAEISQTEFDNLKAAGARFGIVIVAKDLLKGTEINENTVFGANPAFYFTNEEGGDTSKIAMLHIANPSCQNVDDDAQIEICGAIVNIQLNNFTRSFVGRAYVAIPQVNAETGETEYQYSFAPYYNEDVANNTRCIYYIAQRAIEEQDADAETLKQKYIDPFAATPRYTNYTYRYVVEHCYVVHNENEEHQIAHIETETFYATLNSMVEAQPIIKPENVPAIAEWKFIYDMEASAETCKGLVYAAGMQTLRLYYETAGTVSEENKHDTIEALIADFLNVDNAESNFGLHLANNPEDWVASKVEDADGNQIGIGLTATNNASKNRFLLLSKEFFDKLRAFGVESITFDFDTAGTGGKKMQYYVYEEDEETPIRVFDAATGTAYNSGLVSATRITIYLDDIKQAGVFLEVHQSSSSNQGAYEFGNITFAFPTSK